MSIESLYGVNAVSSLDVKQTLPTNVKQTEFDSWLSAQISQVDENIKVAEQQAQKLAVGEVDNLHQVMVAISKARSSFDLMVEVRNRLVEGTQELLRMSI